MDSRGYAVGLEGVLTSADEELTLENVIDRQETLAAEARAALPYNFDECSFYKGPLRQSVFSCIDCGAKGVCYGCSITCHSSHQIVELWTKRAFRCDCPTEAMTICTAAPAESSSSAAQSTTRRCELNPEHDQPYPANEDNRYSQNFKGAFCRCGRDYNPETEPEAMVHCIGCEDWFHESCLNLQGRRTEFTDDDEDEEADCLIPSETYDGLVCAACVEGSTLLKEKRGTDRYMTIVPDDAGTAWTVVGQVEEEKEEMKAEGTEEKDSISKPDTEVAVTSTEESKTAPETKSEETAVPTADADAGEPGAKRPLSDGSPDAAAKRARVDDAEDDGEPPAAAAAAPAPPAPAEPLKAAGDIFLAHSVRAALAESLSASEAAALPFPLVDEEIYEPAKDEQEIETMEEATGRLMNALPRFQAIEAVHGYQQMRDKLTAMLLGLAREGKTVRKEDIDDFFADLRKKHE